ncbi:prepilin-type N-terminal cleavage/methylation domain-containing protein [Dyella mobilis]|uniref:Prepilin-type N-terminal cleavage/methylation domain-containing protein n=2 Tax=Dyella mobilis TaxID=1849582 RepID=A0ABS2KLL9_9GAMM|nr:prepilin-type N-terminal cleavage/methylation domain-containing protein [Dyella mobilis]MBM7132041.1 prepilin-type N-terminal cleavage/methylation domain-containing protein [Dyella mobilis]
MRPVRKLRGPDGFTLIEMMVAMVLGVVVILGVCSVFIANLKSYSTNQALDDVQNESRIAFELMSRDIRSAGMSGCNNTAPVANILNNGPNGAGTKVWWADLGNAVKGYDSGGSDPAITSGFPASASSVSSIELVGGADTGLSVATDNETTQTITFNETTSSLQAGDLLIVCDPNHTSVLQATTYSSGSSLSITHSSTSGTPGNCSNGLGYPTVCTTSGQAYTFAANALVAQLNPVDWYVGEVPSGGTALYRISLQPGTSGATVTATSTEMVPNVTSMKISYLQSPGTTFGTASSVTNWSLVTAVQVQLTMQSTSTNASVTSTPISRTFTSTIAIRNRVL